MRVRKFRKQDAKKASSIISRCQMNILIDYYPAKVCRFFCRKQTPSNLIKKSKRGDYYVAVEGKKVLGIMGLHDNEVKTVFVDPRHHKKGIAKKLMLTIGNTARKKGLIQLKVHSTPYAENFYKKIGFKKIKKVKHTREGISWVDILMIKKLK